MRGGHNFLCRNRAQREPSSRQGRRRRRRGPLAIAKHGSLFCDRFERGGCCHHPISPPPSHKIHVQVSVCERCVPAQALRASYGENSPLRKSSECILGWDGPSKSLLVSPASCLNPRCADVPPCWQISPGEGRKIGKCHMQTARAMPDASPVLGAVHK